MQSRFVVRIAAVLMTMATGGTRVAPAGDRDNLVPLTVAGGIAEITAKGPGHLAALSARQQLRDQVCIAMADGRITHFERSLILANARRILKPEEYTQFRESLDRLSPPMPGAARRLPKLAWGGARREPPATVQPEAPSPAQHSTASTASAEVIVTDRVASVPRAR
jgi:hypothetical protein